MFTRALVVVDRPAPRQLLSWARRLMAPAGGDVRLLVVLPEVRAVVADGRTVAFTDQQEDGARRAAEFALDGVVARLREDGLGASAEVRFGKPSAAVLAAARAWRAEVVAILERPARRWRAWLEGDVVGDILKLSPVPVLVARASGQRSA